MGGYAVMQPSPVQLVKYFLKLGAIAFGGPVALANYMHVDLVERNHWLLRSSGHF